MRVPPEPIMPELLRTPTVAAPQRTEMERRAHDVALRITGLPALGAPPGDLAEGMDVAYGEVEAWIARVSELCQAILADGQTSGSFALAEDPAGARN